MTYVNSVTHSRALLFGDSTFTVRFVAQVLRTLSERAKNQDGPHCNEADGLRHPCLRLFVRAVESNQVMVVGSGNS